MYDCISWINRNHKESGRSTFEKVSGFWSRILYYIINYRKYSDDDIINAVSEIEGIELRKAFDIYYSSKLAEQIGKGSYGIENMDARYLEEDLIENEPELLNKG